MKRMEEFLRESPYPVVFMSIIVVISSILSFTDWLSKPLIITLVVASFLAVMLMIINEVKG